GASPLATGIVFALSDRFPKTLKGLAIKAEPISAVTAATDMYTNPKAPKSKKGATLTDHASFKTNKLSATQRLGSQPKQPG
ncbi:hypothetical protein, partial [Pseudomonas sp. AMR01]|uniref:hypothetical protein n=1 Tax=Pseudomonas sp. AMR01 TaxID=3064904 RepID=UPI0035C228F2